MKWTQRHSENAVRAKARKRLARLHAPVNVGPKRYVPHPRAKARFTIQITDHKHRDSLTMKLYALPWPDRWIVFNSERSTTQLVRSVALILGGG